MPEEIGELKELTSLDLHNNRLVDIPDSLQNLKNLQNLYYEDATITERALKKLEQYFPRIFAQDYYYEAVNLFHREKNQEALYLLKKACKLDPESDKVWFELGFTYDNLKEYEKALECYDKSLELKESTQKIHTTSYILNLANKALTLQSLGKTQEKKLTAQKVLEIFNLQSRYIQQSNANFAFSKGLAFYLLGVYDKAQKAYDDALDIDPYYAVAWYNKACTYAIQEEKKEMLRCLKKAGKLRTAFLRTAPEDQDFISYLEDKDFQELVNLQGLSGFRQVFTF